VGQKVNPIGFRTGITEGWSARWYAPKAAYGEFLIEDQLLRRYIDEKLNRRPPSAQISKIEIERTRNEVMVFIHTARPGMVIGSRGADIEKLTEELEELIDRKVEIKVIEIKQPDLSAQLVAESIAEQLKKRASFRRTMKQRCESTMSAGAKGVKIICKGRLGGAEMARSERQTLGSIPLQTLQAHVDYGYVAGRTKQGTIGVRVWIYTGMYGEEPTEEAAEGGRRPARRGKR
jgi:small subunit ribosomal protein S3